MERSQTIYVFGLFLFMGFSILLPAQNQTIIDWEGNRSCDEMQYCNPEPGPSLQQGWVSGGNALKGNNSRQLTWTTQPGQFCGWIASFGDQGMNAVNFRALTFQIKLVNCSDVFNIQLKDTSGNQITISSPIVMGLHCNLQTVTINFTQHLSKIDFAHLQEINFAFDPNKGCSPTGSIIIDDLQFVR